MFGAAVAACQNYGSAYGKFLAMHPVPAKSLTAGALFAGADVAAQRIERRTNIDKRRTLSSAAVGLIFFGPAAHIWFRFVLRLVPGTGLLSLLIKTALGQVFFGPYITVVFFAAALWSSGLLTKRALMTKVSIDLWPTVLAGLGFWPLMDFVAFAWLSEDFIPPFLNLCSFVWTIFLSWQAARSPPRESLRVRNNAGQY
jgi:protein Mpv17